MSIKSILLHLTKSDTQEAFIEVALGLAVQHGAHINAVYAMAPVNPPTSFMGFVPPEFIERSIEEEKQRAVAATLSFKTLADRAKISYETHQEDGYAVNVLNKHAPAADLVIVAQVDQDDDLTAQYQFLNDELVVSCSKPILIVPYSGKYRDFGKHVLVAWNNTHESARALQYALPFLKLADKVTLLSINPASDQTNQNSAILAYLNRHQIKADLKVSHWKDVSVGNAMLDSLVDLSADMIVMGAYGHSRIREMILGGATKEVLEQMTAPVLFAH